MSGLKTLYFDCSAGISGDMTVAALLDLGANEQILRTALASLPLMDYEIEISHRTRSAIRCCDFLVRLQDDPEGLDHNMHYLHGTGAASQAGHQAACPHSEDHSMTHHHTSAHHSDSSASHHHSHEQNPTHSAPHHHEHTPHGRNLQDVLTILRAGQLTPGALTLAEQIFTIVARAEADVHGLPLNQVHFHEVGAVDSIVDIAAAAICLDDLKPDRVVITHLAEGTGQIRCRHGLLPIPVPAVASIAASQGLDLQILPIQGELVTPTGAAIAAAIRTDRQLPAHFRILKTGYGSGKRDYETCGYLRAMLLEDTSICTIPSSLAPSNGLNSADTLPSTPDFSSGLCFGDTLPSAPDFSSGLTSGDTILKLETNIDDCTGEALGFLMDKLFAAGARDVFYTPIFMKKNRPAWLVSVLCTEDQAPALEALIFAHTSTIGIRKTTMERDCLRRESLDFYSSLGPVRLKVCHHNDQTYAYPEYESVAALCRSRDLPFEETYCRLREEARSGIKIH
ncbi:MAG: LarC family nickel insertion protein [Lachnospiraceae bacterium]|nr:LarC family nickel insertion protein [Lachnospiraceae bacterium]